MKIKQIKLHQAANCWIATFVFSNGDCEQFPTPFTELASGIEVQSVIQAKNPGIPVIMITVNQ